MKTKVKIPRGWRKLSVGAILRRGDKHTMNGLICNFTMHAGKKFLSGQERFGLTYIRRKTKRAKR